MIDRQTDISYYKRNH